jgi:hypothetical protein
VGVAVPIPEPLVPVALPVVVPTRQRVLELCGSLGMSALLAAVLCILWAAVRRTNDLAEMGGYFFLTMACCWAVLIPAKIWATRVEDSWRRRLVLLCLGLGVGLLALWLEGYDLRALFAPESRAAAAEVGDEVPPEEALPAPRNWTLGGLFHSGTALPIAACYLSYFGLAFFVLRWWKMADRRRPQRFSLYAVLTAGFWGYVLQMLWPPPTQPVGFVALVMASVIIQLVSPWEAPPPRPGRRLRLRYS